MLDPEFEERMDPEAFENWKNSQKPVDFERIAQSTAQRDEEDGYGVWFDAKPSGGTEIEIAEG